MKIEPGTRVLAVSHADNKKLYLFGEGVYLGKRIPGQDYRIRPPQGIIGSFLCITATPNHCIQLDNGNHVWGCECWWGPIEAVKKRIGDRELETIDVPAEQERGDKE